MTSRNTQPHVAQSHWTRSETTEHRAFLCVEEDSLSRTLAFNCGHGYTPEEYAVKRDTHTHPFNGPLSGTTRVSRYHKGKTNLDFTGARDSEWQWHQLGHMQACTSHQTDNHASTSLLSFLQAGCPSCRPTNSVKALKAKERHTERVIKLLWPRWQVSHSVMTYWIS